MIWFWFDFGFLVLIFKYDISLSYIYERHKKLIYLLTLTGRIEPFIAFGDLGRRLSENRTKKFFQPVLFSTFCSERSGTEHLFISIISQDPTHHFARSWCRWIPHTISDNFFIGHNFPNDIRKKVTLGFSTTVIFRF